ncbi:MAG: beta-ketoacyl-ACP synthase I [Rhodobacteraceae bacterium]|nr:beta-ketoacyl-ACP synthase I [Paracoccaceae bacterium]
MRRVVITGIGIVCPIGNTVSEVEASLRAGKSGITAEEKYKEHGFRSQVAGIPRIDVSEHIDKRQLRFMGPGAAYSYIAMEQAIADAGLEESDISNERTGLIASSGGPSTSNFFTAFDTVINKGSPKRMGPFMVTRCMSSTVSACLATPFKIKGVNYSITSACSTTLHCMGNGAEQIQMGKQDIVFAGGGEEVDWTLSCLFDAMGAMSSKYNDTPEKASRPFDATRDGFVIGGGGGMVVLEELEHAKARGAKIYAEVTGYGATSDGHDMVAPSGEGGERSMKLALGTLPDGRKVDYINAHGTSTPVGDVTEMMAVRRVFGEEHPVVTSTKSQTGHALGGAGVHEAIYSLIMMEKGFIAPSINVTELAPELRPDEVCTEYREGVELDSVLSNSFGFGGTNASMIMSKFSE